MIGPDRHGRTVAALALTVAVLTGWLTGCTTSAAGTSTSSDSATATGSGVPREWYAALGENVAAAEQADEFGGIPVIYPEERCDITDSVSIAGEDTEREAGSGVSTVGTSGSRYVCQFSGPSVDLVVARFTDAAEFATVDAARRAQQEAGNEQSDFEIIVGDRTFVVIRTVFPTNDSHIDYAVTYLDEAEQGLVRLDIEATDTRDLIDTYDARRAAEDLAAVLDR